MERFRGDRDWHGDSFRERDRYGRGNNRPDFHHQPRRPSLFSDGPPVDQNQSAGNYRGGFSGGSARRVLESPPRNSPAGVGSGFLPGGFRPMGGGVGAFGNDFHAAPPLSGQKRGFPFSDRGGSPAEHYDGRTDAAVRSFVKLFVGSVPRTATEEEIRPLFEGQGKVMEVALIKDKRTGQQQGCCFVKYATSEEADRAIRALHNQYTLPGGVGPIQVRYADGERERLGNGTVEYKLFVGSLNKFASEKEVEEIFALYGRVEDVYLMRDERKQSKGCAFVKFSSKDSALSAINALNGVYTMRGCEQPLIVRFADPKRPKLGEQRMSPGFGGPGFGALPPAVIRPALRPNYSGGQGPPNAWQPMSPPNMVPSPNVGVHGSGNQFSPRSGDAIITVTSVGPHVVEGSGPGAVSASSSSPQKYNQLCAQLPASGQQISSSQKPFRATLQPHQGPGSYSHAQASHGSIGPVKQPQLAGQGLYTQTFPSQHVPSLAGQLPSAQSQVQQSSTSGVSQQNRSSMNLQAHTKSSVANPHTLQPPLSCQQSSSQLQMVSQQTHTFQASFQSSQQEISRSQQQVQMMQPSNQNQSLQLNYQAGKQQSQCDGATPSTAANTTVLKSEVPSTSASVGATIPAPVKCYWTEHISPDGYKYYHNNVTGESTWIKPEELASYEQQQQKLAVQQPPSQPSPQAVPAQHITQSQPPQLQIKFRQTEQFQQPMPPSVYQGPRGVANQTVQDAAYTQLQTPANSTMDSAHFQQASHDWAWKSNSGGT